MFIEVGVIHFLTISHTPIHSQVHPTDVISRPSLYRVNKISYEEQLANLQIILGEAEEISPMLLPTNGDVLNALSDIDKSIG